MPGEPKEVVAARSLADLRKDYSTGGLTEADAGADPFALFHRWLAGDRGRNHRPQRDDPRHLHARRRPVGRAVLLRHSTTAGSRSSPITRQPQRRRNGPTRGWPRVPLAPARTANPRRGHGRIVTTAESDEYFRSAARQPARGMGLAASAVIAGREVLEKSHAELMAKYPDGNPPRPELGRLPCPAHRDRVLQGRPSCLHDRIRFTRTPAGWLRRAAAVRSEYPKPRERLH